MYDIRPAGVGPPNITVPVVVVMAAAAVIDVPTAREVPILTEPVNDGLASDAFDANASVISVLVFTLALFAFKMNAFVISVLVFTFEIKAYLKSESVFE